MANDAAGPRSAAVAVGLAALGVAAVVETAPDFTVAGVLLAALCCLVAAAAMVVVFWERPSADAVGISVL